MISNSCQLTREFIVNIDDMKGITLESPYIIDLYSGFGFHFVLALHSYSSIMDFPNNTIHFVTWHKMRSNINVSITFTKTRIIRKIINVLQMYLSRRQKSKISQYQATLPVLGVCPFFYLERAYISYGTRAHLMC